MPGPHDLQSPCQLRGDGAKRPQSGGDAGGAAKVAMPGGKRIMPGGKALPGGGNCWPRGEFARHAAVLGQQSQRI
ncbi:hypothetical protein [Novosphingobium sp. KACC 22771]|uniref:hypothetical protein n=1 Tax=Novosphingobium sp. KACC 22771 TaxID=3025670 RepID=UPI002365860D|nr:hypothetical protein [Novosphingobium sp. KACC 22771]WDF73280.1 hypothetical protein PQ467_04340 [Novosphingobium sp. KACC 22771]